MRKIKCNWAVICLLWTLSLLGCNGNPAENVENTAEAISTKHLDMYETETMTYDNASDEIIEKAELLTLDMLLVEECVLVKELATIPENVNFVGMTPNNSEDSATNNCFVTNSKGVYYTSGFLVPMGQYAYNLQICHYDYQTKSHQLLYSSEEAIWINELRATDTYLVWLEHLMDET